MLKKNIFIPIVIIFLSIGFLIVSFLVFISKSSPKLLKKKLRIGGLIITLTAAISSTTSSCIPPVTCYEGGYEPYEYENYISFTEDYASDYKYDKKITVDLTSDNILDGSIKNIKSDYFSYRLCDYDFISYQKGDVVFFDETTDSDGKINANFQINLSKNINIGIYNLYIFDNSVDSQMMVPDDEYSNYINKFEIKIVPGN